jgi:serine protease Do
MQFGRKLLALIGGIALASSPLLARQDPPLSPLDSYRVIPVQFQPQGSYLGVRLADIDADRAATLKLSEPRGVEIVQVQHASPAALGGLKPEDVILTYNGENVLGAQQLGRLVSETPPGRRIKIEYWRAGKSATTTLTTRSPIPPFANPLLQSGSAMPPDFWQENSMKLQSDLMRLGASELGMEIPTPITVWKNPVLGLWCEPIDDQLAQYFGVKRGVLVRAVEKNGPADKAGVRAGDVLTSIGDRNVSAPHDVTSYIRGQNQPVKSVTVELTRDHKPLTLHISVATEQQ